MATFPTNLAMLLADGYGEEPGAGVERTPMSDGLVKQARTTARELVARPARFLIRSKADYLAFYDWHETTIGRAGWFDWTDPVDGLTKQARIVGGKVSYRAVRKNAERWIASCSIETWGR